MSHPPPHPDRSAITFPALVEYVIAHPCFPLAIKKVFDVCGSNAFEGSDLLPHFSELERDVTALQRFAETHGNAAAERQLQQYAEGTHGNAAVDSQCSSVDLLMSVLVAALNHLGAAGCAGNPPLQNTIATARKAISNTSTDSRFVGATGNRRVERNQHLAPVRQVEDFRRPDNARRGPDAVQRSDDVQALRGIRKPVQATRTPLSEKAKATLEKWFQEHMDDPYPSAEQKEKLATICAVSLSSVNNWFGNKRMRIKRKMLRVESQGGEQISDKVLAPRSKWNAVVVSKMASQEGREVLESATGRAVPLEKNGEIVKEGQSKQSREPVGPSGPGRPQNRR